MLCTVTCKVVFIHVWRFWKERKMCCFCSTLRTRFLLQKERCWMLSLLLLLLLWTKLLFFLFFFFIIIIIIIFIIRIIIIVIVIIIVTYVSTTFKTSQYSLFHCFAAADTDVQIVFINFIFLLVTFSSGKHCELLILFITLCCFSLFFLALNVSALWFILNFSK